VTIVEQSNGAAPVAPDLIKETTTQTFVKDVIEESRRQPVMIDFWAPWCGPCRQLTPVLEKAVRNAKGKVKLVKMNIDEHPAIPGQMGIQSIPAVIAFVNGQPADGFMGAIPESQVNAFIEKLTKGVTAPGEPNIAEILQEAEAVLAEGDAAAMIESAHAYKDQKILEAEGDAVAFTLRDKEYRRAPDLTRFRLHLEALEEILPAAHKILRPGKGNLKDFDLWLVQPPGSRKNP